SRNEAGDRCERVLMRGSAGQRWSRRQGRAQMTTTAAQVMMELEARLLELARGRPIPKIVDVHSVVLEPDDITVMFDLSTGELLFFMCARPATVRTARDARKFISSLVTQNMAATSSSTH